MQNQERKRQFFKSLEAKSLKSRSFANKMADELTSFSGTPTFLFTNALIFFVWIIINLGLISSIHPFDPFPFGLLTMFVSLEAIFLSIFVLVSQHRSDKISTIREEVHLRVNLIAEEEITKILSLLAEIRTHIGIKTPDEELQKMLNRIDTNYIESAIVRQLQKANRPIGEQLFKEFPDLFASFKKPEEEAKKILNT
jgi:uncharacterized membrane protein